MTRKDYIKLAAALKQAYDRTRNQGEQWGIKAAAYNIAAVLQEDNDRFNKDRFIAACGVEQ